MMAVSTKSFVYYKRSKYPTIMFFSFPGDTYLEELKMNLRNLIAVIKIKILCIIVEWLEFEEIYIIPHGMTRYTVQFWHNSSTVGNINKPDYQQLQKFLDECIYIIHQDNWKSIVDEKRKKDKLFGHMSYNRKIPRIFKKSEKKQSKEDSSKISEMKKNFMSKNKNDIQKSEITNSKITITNQHIDNLNTKSLNKLIKSNSKVLNNSLKNSQSYIGIKRSWNMKSSLAVAGGKKNSNIKLNLPSDISINTIGKKFRKRSAVLSQIALQAALSQERNIVLSSPPNSQFILERAKSIRDTQEISRSAFPICQKQDFKEKQIGTFSPKISLSHTFVMPSNQQKYSSTRLEKESLYEPEILDLCIKKQK